MDMLFVYFFFVVVTYNFLEYYGRFPYPQSKKEKIYNIILNIIFSLFWPITLFIFLLICVWWWICDIYEFFKN